MKKVLELNLIAIMILSIFFIGCDRNESKQATLKMKITDARVPQSNSKSGNSPLFVSNELTRCEITFANIELKKEDGSYISILSAPKTVDLREFHGNAYDLLSIAIPLGSYTHLKISISGVSTTYQNNNYTASVSSGASVTLNNIPGTFNETHGVVNVFAQGNISYEIPLAFTLHNENEIQSVQLHFDVDAAVYVVSYSYQNLTWNFAALHDFFNIGFIFEEGIQQIRHSPPLGITISSADEVSYYGIHTFYDFAGNGGTINSHTSQHVYRGTDGSLTVDAEPMSVNNTPLTPNTVNATGESDIKANEVFKYTEIKNYLASLGYDISVGQVHYFSLRKTWNITSNGQTYEITRMCEPIPITLR